MRLGRAALTLLFLAAVYLAILVYLDERNRLFDNLTRIMRFMPILAALTSITLLLRYARWKWLCQRHGFAMPWFAGFFAYLAGFFCADRLAWPPRRADPRKTSRIPVKNASMTP